MSPRAHPVGPLPALPESAVRLDAISRAWGLRLAALRPDFSLAGSPERTAWRSVVEAVDGRLFVLERIPSRTYGRKRRIAKTLQRLADRGLEPVVAYLPAADGDPLPLVDHALWQMAPYVAGVELDRPAYTMDAWRGDAAADFLVALKTAAGEPAGNTAAPVFSICAYIGELFDTLKTADPAVAERYHPFHDHLARRLFPVHDNLPTGFCHGDFHPLNIIWGRQTVRAVIDWEFCGFKPEIYDLANLLGCLGMEDPASLRGAFAHRLQDRLSKAGIYSAVSWQALPDLTLAIRFAWLSEWLRKKDHPMIRMEADYMALLKDGGMRWPAG